MGKFLLVLSLLVLLSPASHAQSLPLKEFILLQLNSTKHTYNEKKSSRIISYYGEVSIDLDRLTTAEADSLMDIIKKGQITERNLIHDLIEVSWRFLPSLDRPTYFMNFTNEFFTTLEGHSIYSKHGVINKNSYILERRNFPLVHDYEKQEFEKAKIIATNDLHRILGRDLHYVIPISKQLLLPAPSCSSLF